MTSFLHIDNLKTKISKNKNRYEIFIN